MWLETRPNLKYWFPKSKSHSNRASQCPNMHFLFHAFNRGRPDKILMGALKTTKKMTIVYLYYIIIILYATRVWCHRRSVSGANVARLAITAHEVNEYMFSKFSSVCSSSFIHLGTEKEKKKTKERKRKRIKEHQTIQHFGVISTCI